MIPNTEPDNRAIQKYLEDLIAEEILKGGLVEGDTLVADHDGKSDSLFIKIKKKAGEKKEESK